MRILTDGYKDCRDLDWYALMRLRQFFPHSNVNWTLEMLREDIEE